MPLKFNAPTRTTLPSYQSAVGSSGARGSTGSYDPFGNIIQAAAADREGFPSELKGLQSVLVNGRLPDFGEVFGPLFGPSIFQGNNAATIVGTDWANLVATLQGMDLVGDQGNIAQGFNTASSQEDTPFGGLTVTKGVTYGTPDPTVSNLITQLLDPHAQEAQDLLEFVGGSTSAAGTWLTDAQRYFDALRSTVLQPNQKIGQPATRYQRFQPGQPFDPGLPFAQFASRSPQLSGFIDPLKASKDFSATAFEPVTRAYDDLARSLPSTDVEGSNRAFINAENLTAIGRLNEQARIRERQALESALAQAQAGRTAVSDRYQDQSYKNLNQFFGNLEQVDLDAEARMARIDQDYGDLADRFRAREQQALGLLGTLGGTEKRQLARQAAQQRAAQQARNISSGLTNTTVASAQDRRLREQEAEQYGDLQQRLTEQQLGILGQFTGDTLGAAQAGLQAREPINQAALQAQIAGLGRGADAADTITRTAAELEGRTADVGDAWMQALVQSQRDQALTGQQLANTLLQLGQQSYGV